MEQSEGPGQQECTFLQSIYRIDLTLAKTDHVFFRQVSWFAGSMQ